jgi:hypothetical protein
MAFEMPGEMRLVVEPDVDGDLRDRPFATRYERGMRPLPPTWCREGWAVARSCA